MPESPLKIIQFFRCSTRYGASICIYNQLQELRRRGHDVAIVDDVAGSLSNSLASEGIRTISFPQFHKMSPAGILRLRDVLRREAPDILHTHLSKATLPGTIAARMARIPSLATVHGMNRRYTYSFADRVIAVSEAGKRDLITQGLPPSKVVVARNGIPIPDLPNFTDRADAKAALGLPRDAVVMGSVTRLAPGKGIDDALAAFAQLKHQFPKLRLVLAGDGSQMAQLQQQASQLQIDHAVLFLGYCSEVEPVVAAFDIFVLPSHTEGMPLCILEAMALGVPVVATNVGGIPEALEEGAGVMVPVKDARKLAEGCRKLLSDRSLRATMGERARQRAERHFSLHASCDALEAAYRSLLREAESRLPAGAPGTINAGEH